MEVKIKNLAEVLINQFNFSEDDTVILVDDNGDIKLVIPDTEKVSSRNPSGNEVRGVSSEKDILSFIERIRQQMND